jgi:two-component sensor histidine kinase
MRRLVTVDLRRRLRALGPAWLVETGVALGGVALSLLVRVLLDAITPGALALGINYPICLLATLLAGWRAGLLTLGLAGLFAWYFVLSPTHTFALPDLKSQLNVALFFLTAAMVVFLADQAVNEQDKGLAERDLLIDEINHRTKNNFQIVISLLELQARRSEAPSVREAIAATVLRIGGLARAHRSLYTTGGPQPTVAMDAYLAELCENLSEGPGIGGTVRIETDLAPISLPRDRAVAVGIVLNELITNAFKHAFPNGRAGLVTVRLGPGEHGHQLTVADNGVGLGAAATPQGPGGLGRGLIDGFARQAGGTIALAERDGGGVIATLGLRP